MPTPFDYELLVIGGGPAGEKGAAQAAYFGHKTALVEKEAELGGACINTGTLASKTLRESALFLSGFKSRQLYGIEASVKKDITLADFMYRKNYVQERERERARKNLERHDITRLMGSATFVDAHTVSVRTGTGDSQTVTADKILIATGSVPACPANIPFNPDNVFDSETVLQMRRLPGSVLVVGGGVIGCEYAGLFAALGLKVTLVHRSGRLLDFLDAELGEAFMNYMRQMGVELVMDDNLDKVELDGPSVVTTLKGGQRIASEALLYAAGRSGSTAGLGLERLGIKTGKYGHVEGFHPDTFQTNVPNVYAAGDVIGPPALAATSMEQARVAMCHAFDIRYKQHVSNILPYGIYSIPEISGVGETEDSCRKKGIPYVAGRSKFGAHARGQIIGDTEGMIKLIFSAPDGRLLGAHVIGEMASELVHTAMACLHFGGGVQFFIDSVFNYPTLGDVYKYAAYDALGQLNRVREGTRD
jgi:NAD(P) transhydrogenase